MAHNAQLPWSNLASSLECFDHDGARNLYPNVDNYDEAIEEFAAAFARAIREESKNECSTSTKEDAPPDAPPHETATLSARAVEFGLASLDAALFEKVTTDRCKSRDEPRILHQSALEAIQKHIIHDEMQPLLDAAKANASTLRFLWNIPDWSFHVFGPGWSEVMRLALLNYMSLIVFDHKMEKTSGSSFDYRNTTCYEEMFAELSHPSCADVAAEPHREFYCIHRYGASPLDVHEPEPPLSISSSSSSSDTPIVDEGSNIPILPDPLSETNRAQLERYLQYCWTLLIRCDMVATALGRQINWENEVAQCARHLWPHAYEMITAIYKERRPMVNKAASLLEEFLEMDNLARPLRNKKSSNRRKVDRIRVELQELREERRAGETSTESKKLNAIVEELNEELKALGLRRKKLEDREQSLVQRIKEKMKDVNHSMNVFLTNRIEHDKYLGPSYLFYAPGSTIYECGENGLMSRLRAQGLVA